MSGDVPVPVAEFGVRVSQLCVCFPGVVLLRGAVSLLRRAAVFLLGQSVCGGAALAGDLLALGGGFQPPQGRGAGGGHGGRRSAGALRGFPGLFERRRQQEEEGEPLHDAAVMRA